MLHQVFQILKKMSIEEVLEWCERENGNEPIFENEFHDINALYKDENTIQVYKIRKVSKFDRLTIFDNVIEFVIS